METNYDLWYFIPWPESQKIEDIEGHEDFCDWSSLCPGLFVYKKWFDEIKDAYGL